MNVSLTPELEKLVEDKVSSGFYQTGSEVVREALRLFFNQDHAQKQHLEAIREDIRLGLADLDKGKSSMVNREMKERIKTNGRARLEKKRGK